ncbi:hypothetical protein M433DRAFT_7820 [Acidomyces richmondensis BFW]|nr:MAG: hypothetical protein FE78DRAFT_28366 [Acidomyces sp. 'richmondensis']KYG41608.1 hypothetical protein M433DRAFT_7820 [Acidomyces richmondensis BFW]
MPARRPRLISAGHPLLDTQNNGASGGGRCRCAQSAVLCRLPWRARPSPPCAAPHHSTRPRLAAQHCGESPAEGAAEAWRNVESGPKSQRSFALASPRREQAACEFDRRPVGDKADLVGRNKDVSVLIDRPPWALRGLGRLFGLSAEQLHPLTRTQATPPKREAADQACAAPPWAAGPAIASLRVES